MKTHDPLTKLEIYKTISIQWRIFNVSLGATMPYLFSIFGILWMMGVIGCLRLRKIVNLVDLGTLTCIVVSGGVVLSGTIHFSGTIVVQAERFLKLFRFHNMSSYQLKVSRKSLKCCRPFGLKCYPIKSIRHNAFYFYFGGMVNFLVTFLVAHPHLGQR